MIKSLISVYTAKNYHNSIITEEIVDEFVSTVLKKNNKPIKSLPTPVFNSKTIKTKTQNNKWFEEDIGQIYGVTPNTSVLSTPTNLKAETTIKNQKYTQNEFEISNNVRISLLNSSTPILIKGSYAAEWGNSPFTYTTSSPQHCLFQFNQKCDNYFMFQKLTSIISHQQMVNLVQNIQKQNPHIKNFHTLGQVCLDETFVFGRIMAKIPGDRLNEDNIYIEGNLKMCEGKRVHLDISGIQSISFFPGQVSSIFPIVIVQGIHVSSSKFVSHKIISPPVCTMNSKLKGIVTAGPYFPSNDPNYNFIDRIAEIMRSETPELFILIGPFVQEHVLPKHENSEFCCSDFMNGMSDRLFQAAQEFGTKIVIIPSITDVSSIPVYPQEPLFFIQNEAVKCLPNPSFFKTNTFEFIVNSMDILMHMSSFEFSRGEHKIDRISRILKHILNHKNLYPLYPPNAESFIEFNNLSCNANISAEPHLLILPSNLCPFIKKIDNTLCINPSQFYKGTRSSFYCRFQLVGANDGTISQENSIIQILKL
ncbi:hypothetical protein HZS_7645 [Henneguya salminicola]|nr:hypothetical protein HZS_7645 [Henneguya salminicola]